MECQLSGQFRKGRGIVEGIGLYAIRRKRYEVSWPRPHGSEGKGFLKKDIAGTGAQG